MDVVAVRIRKTGLTVTSQTIQTAGCARTLCPNCRGKHQNHYRCCRAPLPGVHNQHSPCQILLAAVPNGDDPRPSRKGLPQPSIALTGSTWPQRSTITRCSFVPRVQFPHRPLGPGSHGSFRSEEYSTSPEIAVIFATFASDACHNSKSARKIVLSSKPVRVTGGWPVMSITNGCDQFYSARDFEALDY